MLGPNCGELLLSVAACSAFADEDVFRYFRDGKAASSRRTPNLGAGFGLAKCGLLRLLGERLIHFQISHL